MGVVGRETEAVVLLKVLIGSHTERQEGKSHDKSPTIELWPINKQYMNTHIENANGATKQFWGKMTEQFQFQLQLK